MIDVIIPAYNCRKTISKTLSSLVAQTDKNFHVIIVDDRSTEDIYSVVSKYRDELDLEYIRNPENIGCGMSRQVGIDAGDSPYFCFLDSDDMFMPYTVEMFNAAIENNPAIEMLCGYFYEQTMINDNHAIVLRKNGFTWCHGKLYSREKIEQYGIKNRPDVKYADDSFFNSMCFELLEAKKIEIPLYLYVNNSSSVTRRIDEKRDREVTGDFLKAMIASCELVLKYKDNIDHLPHTLDMARKNGVFNKEEEILYEKLKELCGKEKSFDG